MSSPVSGLRSGAPGGNVNKQKTMTRAITPEGERQC